MPFLFGLESLNAENHVASSNRINSYSNSLIFKGNGKLIFKGKCTINGQEIKDGIYSKKTVINLLYNSVVTVDNPPSYEECMNNGFNQALHSHKSIFSKKDCFIKWQPTLYSDDNDIITINSNYNAHDILNATTVASRGYSQIKIKNNILAYNTTACDFCKISSQNLESQKIIAAGRHSKIKVQSKLIAQDIIAQSYSKIYSKKIHAQNIDLRGESKMGCKKLVVEMGHIKLAQFSTIDTSFAYLSSCKIKLDTGYIKANEHIVFDNCEFNINILGGNSLWEETAPMNL